MSVFDKVGREIIKMVLDAERERLGEKVIYVVDTEMRTHLENQEKILRAILRCLSSMSGLNIDEEDIT